MTTAFRPLALLIALFLFTGCGTTRFMANATEPALARPPAGQVLVNIFRPSSYAGGQDLPLIDATAMTLIGNLRGKERMQYVCPPGERLFMGWGEHKSGVQATLLADETYDLICDTGMGFWRASVSLRPIPNPDDRRAKLAEWEADTRLLVGNPTSADAMAWISGKREDVQRIAAEWNTSPTDRVMTLAATDHR